MTTFRKILLVLSMLAGFSACGPDGGDATAPADGGACSSVDAGPAVSLFLGSWQPTAGTTSCTCSDGSTLTNPADPTDTSIISAGCGSAQITITDSGTGCSETCEVSGTTATCHPTTCTVAGVTLKTVSDVYTLTDGQIRETGSGTETFPNGISCQCATSNDAYGRTP